MLSFIIHLPSPSALLLLLQADKVWVSHPGLYPTSPSGEEYDECFLLDCSPPLV